jgi:hypothetical protein
VKFGKTSEREPGVGKANYDQLPKLLEMND